MKINENTEITLEIDFKADIDVEPAQKGGLTDPSWDEHLSIIIDIDEKKVLEMVYDAISEQIQANWERGADI